MHALSASDVLQAWEFGQTQPAQERSLTLLALASGTPHAQLAALPVGQRDAQLLSLREITLGPKLECITQCPSCEERVVTSLLVEDMRTSGPSAHEALEKEELMITANDYRLTFRLPNTLDLVAIRNTDDETAARQELIRRCVLEATHKEVPVDPAELPAEVETRLVERIVQADPSADILLDLTCPNCNHRWQSVFDISGFFWAEIDSLARRLLRDVHVLAQAYGWREPDILAMSAVRRQAYLEMVAG